MLSSNERTIRTICHEEPDAVPVFEPYGVLPPTADIVLGRPCIATSEFRCVRLFVKKGEERCRASVRRDWIDLVRRLGFDAAPLMPGTPTSTSPPRLLGDHAWSVGDAVYKHDPTTGTTIEVESKIKSEGIPALKEHVENLENETDDEIEQAVNDQTDEALIKAWRRLGVLVYAGCGTVPVRASWLPLFVACFAGRQDLIRRYLKQRTRRTVIAGRIAADLGAELMFIGGDIAFNEGPMVSPKQYHDLILPEMRAQAAAMHREGIFCFISSDGNLWPIIDDYLMNSGVDGMMEIQVTAGMDPARLKERYGDRICFIGSVDCQFTMVSGKPAQVAQETAKALETLSPGGGHILSSSNSIHSGVKPENFFAMLGTARKTGQYGRSGKIG